jgi:hypothetical protein
MDDFTITSPRLSIHVNIPMEYVRHVEIVQEILYASGLHEPTIQRIMRAYGSLEEENDSLFHGLLTNIVQYELSEYENGRAINSRKVSLEYARSCLESPDSTSAAKLSSTPNPNPSLPLLLVPIHRLDTFCSTAAATPTKQPSTPYPVVTPQISCWRRIIRFCIFL